MADQPGQSAIKSFITLLSFLIALALATYKLYDAVGRLNPREDAWSKYAMANGPYVLDVNSTLGRLLSEEDTDHDDKITIDDEEKGDGSKGDKVFVMKDKSGSELRVRGTYALSVLLQELSLARDSGKDMLALPRSILEEDPVARISRLIRTMYWDNLTRRVDAGGLLLLSRDEKSVSRDGAIRVYVPPDDPGAIAYFQSAAAGDPELEVKVEILPEKITPEYVRSLDGKHGVLTLRLEEGPDGKGLRGTPFVAPGGRFNEMYGWDSYFEALGLIQDGRLDLAQAMVDNFVYQINHYGKILNANRTYYLTRSQPPFLTSMAMAVYRAGVDKSGDSPAKREWLATALLAAIKEYDQVWISSPRAMKMGLSRYYGEGQGPCPEVEPGHYDEILKPYADKVGVSPAEYLEGYLAGTYRDKTLEEFFVHDRSVRESGHDTTYRFDDRTADFATVDLNSLLYKYETDLAWAIANIFQDGDSLGPAGAALALESAEKWEERAKDRRLAADRYLWDGEKGMYFDYDASRRRTSDYVSAAAFYPLWAGLASEEQARRVVENALPLLEEPGGVAASTEDSRGPITAERPQRQWDYPYGWAPHQMLVWEGLRKHGYGREADRLTYKWLYMITRNAADYNGTIPEKYDVVSMTHRIFAEYGNVGTKFSYVTKEGFGWMNASYQVGLASLPDELKDKLKKLTPPEEALSQDQAESKAGLPERRE